MGELRISGDLPADAQVADGIPELRANVLIALASVRDSVVAVTSPHASEKRRHVAAHLAAALAVTGRRVLLIDADVAPGAATSGNGAPVDLGNNLFARASAAVLSGDPALLLSEAFEAELGARRSEFDITVVACPALLDVPETRAVAAMATGALLVVDDGHSNRDDAIRAARIMRDAGVRTLGAVIAQPGRGASGG